MALVFVAVEVVTKSDEVVPNKPHVVFDVTHSASRETYNP
jgi:hypothetical protein